MSKNYPNINFDIPLFNNENDFNPYSDIQKDIGIDGNYSENIGIKCTLCQRQPQEKESLIYLTPCHHIFCLNCFNFLKNCKRKPVCPYCLQESKDLKF